MRKYSSLLLESKINQVGESLNEISEMLTELCSSDELQNSLKRNIGIVHGNIQILKKNLYSGSGDMSRLMELIVLIDNVLNDKNYE